MNRFLKQSIAATIFLLTIGLVPTAQAQLTEIKHTFPKIVPLNVEFKNYDKENWWHDLEIKVTNTGKKPISYLSLYLELDSTYQEGGGSESGKQMSIGFKFGDVQRFFSSTNGEKASSDDPAILPGESYTFKVGDNFIKGWDLRKNLGRFAEPHKAELTHEFTNFGDGSGLEAGGTPWRTPNKNRKF